MVNKSPKSKRWSDSEKAIRATQLAFDLETKLIKSIKQDACSEGITPSDKIRQILGLETTHKRIRPRLTISLKDEDYIFLAKKYGLNPSDRLGIKTKIIEVIREYGTKSSKSR